MVRNKEIFYIYISLLADDLNWEKNKYFRTFNFIEHEFCVLALY